MLRYVSRRKNALYDSPSKDPRIRRRLFESPRKSKMYGPSHLQTTIAIAVTFLVGVHLYVFKSTSITLTFAPRDTINYAESLKESKKKKKKKNDVVPRKRSVQSQWPPADLHPLSPLKQKDLEQYTVRINTWRRPEQLLVSVDHHSSCPGVAQIQIVWCDKENEPPAELSNYSKVVIERHEYNSLNERFRILLPAPTLGILSIDDDALRPCEALDDGFFKWTRHPDRMIGFDARLHVQDDDGSWKYGYMSTMERSNSYSLSLTRYCFVHKDYMDIYFLLPSSILDKIATNFECEDIAMSFMISSLTGGKPSLLADLWAIKSMVKLFVEEKISGGKNHKSLRDECVNTFAEIMGLKEGANKLQIQPYLHEKGFFFECGDIPNSDESHPMAEREKELDDLKSHWHNTGRSKMVSELKRLMGKTAILAYRKGLIQSSEKWKERFHPDAHPSGSK